MQMFASKKRCLKFSRLVGFALKTNVLAVGTNLFIFYDDFAFGASV